MSTGRFTVLAQPSAAPGHCLLCRSTANGPFIDTGFSIQWEGAVYICAGCLIAMHNELPQQQHDKALDLVQAYQAGAFDTVDKVKAIFDEFADRISNSINELSPAGAGLSIVEVTSDDGEDNADQSGDAVSADSTAVEDERVTGDEGPDSVPSDSSDGLLLDV